MPRPPAAPGVQALRQLERDRVLLEPVERVRHVGLEVEVAAVAEEQLLKPQVRRVPHAPAAAPTPRTAADARAPRRASQPPAPARRPHAAAVSDVHALRAPAASVPAFPDLPPAAGLPGHAVPGPNRPAAAGVASGGAGVG